MQSSQDNSDESSHIFYLLILSVNLFFVSTRSQLPQSSRFFAANFVSKTIIRIELILDDRRAVVGNYAKISWFEKLYNMK